MFLAGMLGAGVVGVVIERFAYRPLRNAPRIAVLISALGVSFFLQNSMLLLFGAQFRSYESFQLGSANPEVFEPGPLVEPVFTVAGVNVQLIQLVVFATTILLMVALTLVIARTRLGKAMRATAFDREAAAMMGIDVDRVIASTFFIGSVLAGAAGVMFGLMFSQIFHFMGFLAGLKGFTAAVVGGIGSIPGAMLGGLLVGLVEAFAQGYLGGQWSDVTVFAILIGVLLVRPTRPPRRPRDPEGLMDTRSDRPGPGERRARLIARRGRRVGGAGRYAQGAPDGRRWRGSPDREGRDARNPARTRRRPRRAGAAVAE